MKPKTVALWATLTPVTLLLLGILAVNVLHTLRREEQSSPAIKRYLVLTADPFDAGREAMEAGDFEAARDYWLGIESDHERYAKAQRFIGWELYGERLGDPLAGVPYVNRALFEDPLDGNAWQDWSRTYAAAVGFDVGVAPRPRRLDGSVRP